MKLLRKILLISMIFLSGCWKYSISNIDQPPPYMYETWRKSGRNEVDIKKDMLACGYLSVYHVNQYMYEKIGIFDKDGRMNHYFIVSLCMEKLGYARTKTFKDTVYESCSETTNFPQRKNYPACQSNVVVPDPSEERRLNGPYCVMEKNEYRRCKIEIDDWRCGSNTFPLECYSNVEYEQYLKSKISPYPPNKYNSSVHGVGATPESMRMRNQQLEMDLLQNQTRQEANKEMNRMMQQ